MARGRDYARNGAQPLPPAYRFLTSEGSEKRRDFGALEQGEEGRKALERYLDHMEALIKAMKG